MKQYFNVKSYDKPKARELNYNTLYIRSHIEKEYVEDLGREMYTYDEIQYQGNEILEYLDNRRIENEQLLTDIELNQITSDQMLTEIELTLLEIRGGQVNEAK